MNSGEVQQTLSSESGQAALEKVILRKLIMQEGQRCKVKIPPEELELPKGFADHPSRTELKKDLLANRTLRALLVSEISEQDKRETYELFVDQLTQYELSVAESDFEQPKTSTRHTLTLPQLEREFGTEVAAKIISLTPGGSTVSVATPRGKVAIGLVSVRGSYGELVPEIENVIANSRRTAFLNTLTARAQIRFPGIHDAKE